MLFVALLKLKSGTLEERVAHRARFQYPTGVRVIGEYWLQSGELASITIFEADSIQSIMTATAEWAETFDITVIPAITAEDGLKWAQQMKQQMGARK